MKNGLILIGAVFSVTLAAIVGNRLSNEAMAVVVGALCGISASVPMTIGVMLAINQNWNRAEPPREIGFDYGAQKFAAQPPMIVVAPPQMQPQAPYGFAANPYYLPANIAAPLAPREFKIIGDD